MIFQVYFPMALKMDTTTIIIPQTEYERLLALDSSELREVDPDLVMVLPYLSDDEILYYLGHGTLPGYPNLREALNRYDVLKRQVEPFIADLILQVYDGDLNQYLFHPRSDFREKILLAYNEVMGFPDLVRALADANNLTLSDYSDEGVDNAFIQALLLP